MALTNQQLIKLYVNMVRARRIDELLITAMGDGRSLAFLLVGIAVKVTGEVKGDADFDALKALF